MNEPHLSNLIDKYLTNSITEAEREELSVLISQPEYQAVLEDRMLAEFRSGKFQGEGHDQIISQIEANLRKKTEVKKSSAVLHLPAWAAAAAAIVLIAGSYFVFFHKPASEIKPSVATAQKVGQPGGNRAVLKLDNGIRIELDSASNGQLAQQGSTKIIKTESGKLLYTNKGELNDKLLLNTLTTPRGGVYQLTLPDGTRVWLNASSSITYPTAFNTARRDVKITGELYFEVAKDRSKPFHVSVNGIDVEVLGTHFNINAYDNEMDMKTTLLEGSIRLRYVNTATILKPGDQAQIGRDGKVNILKQDDLDQVISWKSGYFNFRNADLSTIMRQLERWYDIDVKYEGELPKRRFQGQLPRNFQLSAILKVFNEMKINYKLKGQTLIISK